MNLFLKILVIIWPMTVMRMVSSQCPSDSPVAIGDFSIQDVTVSTDEPFNFVINGGSGTCIIAMFVYNNTVQETHVDDFSEVEASLPSLAYPEVGDYYVVLYASNNQTSKHSVGAIMVDETLMDVTATELPSVEFESISWIKFNLTSGTRFTIYMDWGDSLMDTYYYNTVDEAQHFGHVYADLGSFEAEIFAVNSVSQGNIKMITHVEYLVQMLTIQAPSSIAYPPGIAEITLTVDDSVESPNNVNCSLWKDNITEIVTTPANFTDKTDVLNLTIDVIGLYSYTIHCYNHISKQNNAALTFVLDVVTALVGLSVEILDLLVDYCLPVGIEKDFIVTATAGSNSTVLVDYNDSISEEKDFPYVDVSQGNVNFTKAYSTIGNYTVNVTGYNTISNLLILIPIEVLVPISELQILAPNVSLPSVTYSLQLIVDVTVTSDPLDSVNCTMTFGDGSEEVRFIDTLSGSVTPITGLVTIGDISLFDFLKIYDNTPANVSSTVTCTNRVSNITAEAAVEIRLPIEGLSLSTNRDRNVGEVSAPNNIDITFVSGSNVTIEVICDDGGTGVVDTYIIPPGSLAYVVDCSYPAPGNYSVAVFADNEVSKENASIMLIIQQRIIDIAVTSDSPQPYPADIMFSFVTVDPKPTDVFILFDFDNDGVTDTENTHAPLISTLTTSTHTITFGTDYLGTYNCSVFMSNLVSNQTKFVEIIIVKAIVDPLIMPPSMYVPAGQEATIHVTLTYGSHVTYFLDFADSTNVAFTPDIALQDGMTFSTNHTFIINGVYILTGNASNALGEVPFPDYEIHALWPLVESEIDIDLIPYVKVPPSKGYLTFMLTNDSLHLPDDVISVVNLPNTITERAVLSWPFTIECDFGANAVLGYAEVSVTLMNDVSLVQFNKTFYLEAEIFGSYISGDEYLLQFSTLPYILGVVNGSDVNVTVESEIGSFQLFFIEPNLPLYMIFTNLGFKNISALFFNHVSNESVIVYLTVQPTVNFSSINNAPIELPDQLNWTLLLEPPVKANLFSFDIQYGDGSVATFTDVHVEGYQSFVHAYVEFGSYPALVNISNIVSFQIIDELFHADIPIAGANFSVFSLLNTTDEDVGIVFETAVPVYFLGYVSSGSRVNYTYSVSGYPSVEGQNSHMNFIDDGPFSVTLTAYNFVGSVNETQIVWIISPVGLTNYDQPDKIYLIHTLHVELTFDLAKNICLHFVYQGPIPVEMWHESRVGMCGEYAQGYQEGTIVDLLPWGDIFHVSTMFQMFGDYVETLSMYTEYASQSKMFDLHVSKHACEDPVILVPDIPGKYAIDPIKVKKSDVLEVSTEDGVASISCIETSFFSTTWDLFKLESPSDTRGVSLENPGIRKEKFFLTVQPGVLDYGLHRVKLGIFMSEGFTEFNTSVDLFYEVVPSPLVAEIYPGAFRTVGNQVPVYVNASQTSFDADNPEFSLAPLIFTWFCQREGEVLLPPVDLVTHFSTWDTIIAVPKEGDPVIPGPGSGGCFNTGIGRLDMTAGDFIIPPGHLSPGTYLITLRVEKGIRSTIATQELTVINGNPLTVDIITDKRPGCSSGYSPEVDHVFYGSCVECGPDTAVDNMEWELADALEVTIPTNAISSVTSESGGISEAWTLHSSSLDYDQTYTVALRVTPESGDYDEGLGKVALMTTTPPVPGYCNVDPEESIFVKESVGIHCLEWSDNSGEFIDITTTTTATVAGVTSDVPSSNAYLPVGDPANDFNVVLTIKATEPCGSSYSVTKNVIVRPSGYVDGMSPDDLFMLLVEQITDAVNSLDFEGIKLAPSNAVSLISAAAASIDLSDPRAVEALNALIDLLQALILGDDPFTKSTYLVLAEGLENLASTITPDMEDSKLGLFFEMLDKLADAVPDLLEGVLDVPLLTKMSSALAGTAVILIDNLAVVEEIKAAQVFRPEDPPTEFENLPPELQELIKKHEAEEDKSRMKALLNVWDKLADAALEIAVRNKHGITLGNEKFMVKSTVTKKSMVNLTAIETSRFTAELEEIGTLPCEGESTFFQTAYSEKNVINYGEGGKETNGPMAKMRMFIERCFGEDAGPSPVDYHGLFIVTLDVPDHKYPKVNMTQSVLDVNTSMIYYYIPVGESDLALVIDFDPIPDLYEGEQLLVFSIFRAEEKIWYKPKQTYYDQFDSLPKFGVPNPWSIVIHDNVSMSPGVYVGLLLVHPTFTDSMREIVTVDGLNKSVVPADEIVLKDFDFPFDVHSSYTACRNWNSHLEEWQNIQCIISNLTTTCITKCECTSSNEASNIMAPAFKPPTINTIDFRNVLSNFAALLQGNPAVFATIVTIFVVFILLLIWARRADGYDVIKWGIYPLFDNVGGASWRYTVTVITGVRQRSGTTSKVRMIVSGEHGDTGTRMVEGGPFKGFGHGSVRHYLMTTEESLGPLTHIHIWHDNSGKGDNKNWFLDKVIIEDLQADVTYHFLCDQWLAVDETDGNIERVLPVAGHEQLVDSKNLFTLTSRKKISEEHLWISIFARPERSKFTRKERLACGASFLFITMITDAMWFKSSESAENDVAIYIGPIVISAATVYVSVMATLCSLPLTTIIILFFQKSRPRPLKANESPRGFDPPKAFYKPKSERTELENLAVKQYWRQYPLPYWCTYIAWILAVLAIMLSAFFVILYSLEWGKERAEEWLSAFFLSFFQNAFVIEPIKVVVITVIIACILKKLDERDQIDYKKTILSTDMENGLENQDRNDSDLAPLQDEALERARYIGMRRKLAKRTIKEVCLYIIFLAIVMYLAWGSRSSADYLIKRSVLAMLKPSVTINRHMSINQISDGRKMWRWIKQILIPNMYWQRYYNDAPTSRLFGKYINDFNSVKLGTVRLRQVRIKPEFCLPGIPHRTCRPEYGFLTEEDRDFTEKWSHIVNSSLPSNTRIADAFRFKSFLDLQSIPYFGASGLYGGGGYVADLGNNSASAQYLIDLMIEHDWVDKRTRAVFFETTIYNANVHVFASIICLFEFPPTGGVLPRIHVDTFHAYATGGSMGTVNVFIMVLFVLFLLYLIIHEALKIKENPKKYFEDPWNKVEVLFLTLAFACVGMNGSKEAYSRYITKKIQENKDANIGYMQLSAYEIAYNAMVGIVAFIATVKCLRILNFSSNVRELGRALKLVRQELLSFSVVFFAIYIGFALLGNQMFGYDMYDYSTFIRSMESLFATLLGKYDFPGLVMRSPVTGKLFLFLYNLTILILMVNIFISLLTFAFDEAREDVADSLEDDVWVYIFHRIKVLICLEKESTTDDTDFEKQQEDEVHEEEERRQQLRSLEVHLQFLSQYMKNAVEKQDDLPDFIKYDQQALDKLQNIMKSESNIQVAAGEKEAQGQ